MRGEHHRNSSQGLMAMGSSPHARGALTTSPHKRRRTGIIPACAGSTFEGRAARGDLGDHPRMRGEHRPCRQSPCHCEGSSPHARGAHEDFGALDVHTGIIPACAGSTTLVESRIKLPRDHPRMRGEHYRTLRPHAMLSGSSPHARGAHCKGASAPPQAGIIPACAGSTSLQSCP